MARGTSSPTNQDDIGKGDTSQGSAASMATNVDRNAGATMDPSAAQGSAIEMLKQDHRKVEGLFEQFEQSSDDERKEDLVEQICEALILHMRLEEDIFYPACRKAGVEEDTMDEAQVEHDGAKAFLNDLLHGHSGERFWEAKVSVLKEMIKHHVAEEEKPGDGAFAQAVAHHIDDAALAPRLRSRKRELQRRAAGKQPIRPVSLNPEEDSPEYGYAERDDRGRFMSDDDGNYGRSRHRDDDDARHGGRGRGRGGWFGDSERHSEAARSRGYAGRDRYADDERYGDSRRYADDEGYGRERDERGRFTSDDDDRRYGLERDDRGRFVSDDDDRRYLGRPRDDDDERHGRGRGHGGWFGDSEGHSRAARSRSDDDRRSSGRSRRHEDDGRGHGGWYGDPRGHAEASRRGWQHRR